MSELEPDLDEYVECEMCYELFPEEEVDKVCSACNQQLLDEMEEEG